MAYGIELYLPSGDKELTIDGMYLKLQQTINFTFTTVNTAPGISYETFSVPAITNSTDWIITYDYPEAPLFETEYRPETDSISTGSFVMAYGKYGQGDAVEMQINVWRK